MVAGGAGVVVWSGFPTHGEFPVSDTRVCSYQWVVPAGLMNVCVPAGLGRLWEPGPGGQQISDLWFALILHLDTDSEEQTLPFPVPSERLPLRRMSPFSSTLNLQPSFPGRSYFDFRSSPHQLSLHSSLQSLNAPGELSCWIFPFISVSWRHLWKTCVVLAICVRGGSGGRGWGGDLCLCLWLPAWLRELSGILVCMVERPTPELWSMCDGTGTGCTKLFFLHQRVPPWKTCSSSHATP